MLPREGGDLYSTGAQTLRNLFLSSENRKQRLEVRVQSVESEKEVEGSVWQRTGYLRG